MALLTAGYWQTTYWVSGYWVSDYWAEYGTKIAIIIARPRIHYLPPQIEIRTLPVPIDIIEETAPVDFEDKEVTFEEVPFEELLERFMRR